MIIDDVVDLPDERLQSTGERSKETIGSCRAPTLINHASLVYIILCTFLRCARRLDGFLDFASRILSAVVVLALSTIKHYIFLFNSVFIGRDKTNFFYEGIFQYCFLAFMQL